MIIVQSPHTHRIGQRIIFWNDIDNDKDKYPGVVIREATVQEYLKNVKERYPDHNQKVWCKYFYEVITD
jgi:hypothetical protein